VARKKPEPRAPRLRGSSPKAKKTLNPPPDCGRPTPPSFGADHAQWRQDTRSYLVSGAVAKGTKAGRTTAWGQWKAFRGKADPWIRTENLSEDERIAAEDSVLDWIGHLAFVLRRQYSTIKNKVGHLAVVHVERGVRNPIDGFDRVRRALRNLKRQQGGGPTEVPGRSQHHPEGDAPGGGLVVEG